MSVSTSGPRGKSLCCEAGELNKGAKRICVASNAAEFQCQLSGLA